MCQSVCVCVRMFMYVCKVVCFGYVYMCVGGYDIFMCLCVCLNIVVYVYFCLFYVFVCECMCECMYMCVYVCLYVCVVSELVCMFM